MKYLTLVGLFGGFALSLSASAPREGDSDISFEAVTIVLSQSVANAARIEIYEGLPKDLAAPDRQKRTNSGRQIENQSFYSVPDEIRMKHAIKFQRLVDGGLLQPWRAGKTCGDFHADYAIAITFPKVTLYVLFSLACREARIIRESNPFAVDMRATDFRVTLDLNDKTFEELRSLLTGYHSPERDSAP